MRSKKHDLEEKVVLVKNVLKDEVNEDFARFLVHIIHQADSKINQQQQQQQQQTSSAHVCLFKRKNA